MEQTAQGVLEGIDLAYETKGSGEWVVLIHAGVCADFFKPLLQEQTLTDRYRLLRYHRAGYGQSSRLEGPVSIAQLADHSRALMRHLGIERAHIVGHSSSAMMALQLALDAPDVVQTLALLDSARPAPESELQTEFVRSVAQPALQYYRAGNKALAIDTWMLGTCGPDYRTALSQALPGAFEQAVTDADTFFGQELPAVQQWSFRPQEASRITQPILAVLGEKSRATFRERRELLLAWLPNARPFTLPNATHLLHVDNPGDMARGLVTFFAHHPL